MWVQIPYHDNMNHYDTFICLAIISFSRVHSQIFQLHLHIKGEMSHWAHDSEAFIAYLHCGIKQNWAVTQGVVTNISRAYCCFCLLFSLTGRFVSRIHVKSLFFSWLHSVSILALHKTFSDITMLNCRDTIPILRGLASKEVTEILIRWLHLVWSLMELTGDLHHSVSDLSQSPKCFFHIL